MTFGGLSVRMALLLAVYRWCNDNRLVPCLLLQVQAGVVVVNISQEAVRNLTVTPVTVEFQASYDGRLGTTTARLSDIVAIYSGSTGEGILLADYPLLSNPTSSSLSSWSLWVSPEGLRSDD